MRASELSDGVGDDGWGESIKDHHPMETLPLRAIVRKLVWMRLVVCSRQLKSSLKTQKGRQRALLGVAAVVAIILLSLSVGHLPDPNDATHAGVVHQHQYQHQQHSLHHGAPQDKWVFSAGGVAVPNETDTSSPPPPSPAALDSDDASMDENSDAYAAQLRRRAAELNQEILRFRDHENKANKAQRLRKTAEQLDAELKQLKQVRESSFSLQAAIGARRLSTQPSLPAGEQPRQQQGTTANGTQPSIFGDGMAARVRASRSRSGLITPLAPLPPTLDAAKRPSVLDALNAARTLRGKAQAAAASAAAAEARVLDSSLAGLQQATAGGDGGLGDSGLGGGVGGGERSGVSGGDGLGGDGGVGAGGVAAAACGKPHPEFRIAILLPWVTEEHSTTRYPPWLPYFVASARHSAMLIDFLMIHEGPLGSEELPPAARSPNVRFMDVGTGGIAALIASGMGAKLHLPEANTSALSVRLRFILAKWPRLVAEYKPAFGTIFAEQLANYTHWGYSDLDVILGHLPRFVERSELVDYHIVTYSFGDADAIYLRGQWTVHRNLAQVNQIWTGCEHLGRGLEHEVYTKVAWARQNEAAGHHSYHKRFLSAEGCYSHRALHTKGIRVKVAVKQSAGLELLEHAKEVVYVVRGALWICQEHRAHAAAAEPNVATLSGASAPACDMALPGVQTGVGEPTPLETSGDGCGAWMPSEFRVCAPALKGRTHRTVLCRSGVLSAQQYEEAPSVLAEGGRCRQVALFHMQEWKKRWQDGRTHVDHAARYDNFRLTQDGIRPLLTTPPVAFATMAAV